MLLARFKLTKTILTLHEQLRYTSSDVLLGSTLSPPDVLARLTYPGSMADLLLRASGTYSVPSGLARERRHVRLLPSRLTP